MKRILKVQKEIGNLSKKSENPFFKSAYLDLNDLLNAVKPLLEAEGLLLMQPILNNEVNTTIYDADSGEILAISSIKLPEETNPQKLGSCITYYRRYTLKSLLAIAEKDDDGNAGAKPTKQALTDNQFERMLKKDNDFLKNALNEYTLNEVQIKIIELKIAID